MYEDQEYDNSEHLSGQNRLGLLTFLVFEICLSGGQQTFI
jgi:hypothetical protein